MKTKKIKELTIEEVKELKELKKDNRSLTKAIAQLTEVDYYFITSMVLDTLKTNSNFALMYVDDIFCLVDTKENSFEVIDDYAIDTENIGNSKYQELDDLREFARIVVEKSVDIICLKYCTNVNDYNVGFDKDQELDKTEFDLVKKVVEKYENKEN